MGTRSDIIARLKNGRWARIYCHWDGAPDHNGKILAEHYTTQAKIEKLIKLGDISVLAPGVTKPPGHTFDTPVKGYCISYSRDRDEDAPPFYGVSLEEVWDHITGGGTEYAYVWDGEQWHVGDPDKTPADLFTLDTVLSFKNRVTSNIKAFGGNFVIGKHV